MKQLHLLLLAGLLTLIASALFLYKVAGLGFPLAPGQDIGVWTLQARLTIDGSSGPISATLQIPGDTPGFTILEENFVSRGYGLTTHEDNDSREAQWAIRQATGRQSLYYRARAIADTRQARPLSPPPLPGVPALEEPFYTAMSTLVAEIQQQSADAATYSAELLRRLNARSPDENIELFLSEGRSPARRASIAATLLAGARIPARVAYGLELEDRQRYAVFTPWLEVHDGDRWIYFNPETGEQGLPDTFLIWWRGDRSLIDVTGASNPEVQISVWGSRVEALEIAGQRADLRRSRLVEFSLLSLPIQTQAVFSILLLVPIGAFLMVILRNVVGLSTFGTFMPVLIALAFRETRLFWGLLLFSLVVFVGLAVRFYLEQLRLLMVPRLAAVLITVILILATISIVSNKLGLETGLSVALFPLVIMTMGIEHMSVVWEERGPAEAFKEGTGTLIVAAFAHLVMNLDIVEHLVFVFPELLLIVLAATLLLGRYSGYRLLELVRFRSLAANRDLSDR